jgi:hypothetical protein
MRIRFMLYTWLPCVVLCLAGGQDGSLELTNARRTYGHLGAPRPAAGILPGDTAYFSFDIKNLKFDGDGKAAYSIAIEIRDQAGKLMYEQKPYNAVAQNFLGGNSLPCAAHVFIPLDTKPGAVDWTVTVKDRATKQSAVLKGKGKVLPADFGLVQVGLFADVDGATPMSAVAVVGDSAYLKFSTVGFARDKETKQPNVNVSLRILDDKGQPTMAKPLTGKINGGIGADDPFLVNQFGLSFNRAGRFTIELSAEDMNTGKRSQVSYAIRVLAVE